MADGDFHKLELRMQHDCNLVLYDWEEGWWSDELSATALWDSSDDGSRYSLHDGQDC